ncbi:MAG: hypothetical protein KME23_12565 [Goleter apudmare HA4340-LM2]|jgi:hypothetical protein|nr:hypothetical protein [Goleter apudmare HA4340-LM2]
MNWAIMSSKKLLFNYTCSLAIGLTLTTFPLLAQAQSNLIGLSGGSGGSSFAIQCPGNIRKIYIRAGRRIDSIGFYCESGKAEYASTVGGNGGTQYTFNLKPGEYLRGIRGRYGKCGKKSTRICSIQFITNQRYSLEYGGTGPASGTFNYELPSDEVYGFYGRSGKNIDAIGIITRPR